jgi:hypothetical protein
MKNRTPNFDPTAAPAHLSPESAAWWKWIWSEYDLDEGQAPVLQAALEARDRAAEARAAMADGCIVTDRFGQAKPHPALLVERDALSLMVRAWKTLGLGAPEPRPIGRPPIPTT